MFFLQNNLKLNVCRIFINSIFHKSTPLSPICAMINKKDVSSTWTLSNKKDISPTCAMANKKDLNSLNAL